MTLKQQISTLSIAEKILLVEQIWEEIEEFKHDQPYPILLSKKRK